MLKPRALDWNLRVTLTNFVCRPIRSFGAQHALFQRSKAATRGLSSPGRQATLLRFVALWRDGSHVPDFTPWGARCEEEGGGVLCKQTPVVDSLSI